MWVKESAREHGLSPNHSTNFYRTDNNVYFIDMRIFKHSKTNISCMHACIGYHSSCVQFRFKTALNEKCAGWVRHYNIIMIIRLQNIQQKMVTAVSTAVNRFCVGAWILSNDPGSYGARIYIRRVCAKRNLSIKSLFIAATFYFRNAIKL